MLLIRNEAASEQQKCERTDSRGIPDVDFAGLDNLVVDTVPAMELVVLEKDRTRMDIDVSL